MATKSFLKNVNLHGRRECQDFIRALERSDETPAPAMPTEESIKVHNMSKDVIRKVFSENASTETGTAAIN